VCSPGGSCACRHGLDHHRHPDPSEAILNAG
jgi:hypothetical protein